jgi:NADH:ubiquinone oxidoreductase subunit K
MILPVDHLAYLSILLFSTGLMIIIIKRNAILMLIGIELMLNAANVNLVAFNQLHPSNSDGQLFALFIIIVAVCETAVGLAIILRVYHNFNTSVPDHASELKD